VAGQGESGPDLIGLSHDGDWYVFEAKGRSNGFDALALATAKEQVEQIISIDNLAPVCSIACQAYFPRVVSASGWMIPGRSETIDLEQSR
jgi:hypothetical protein